MTKRRFWDSLNPNPNTNPNPILKKTNPNPFFGEKTKRHPNIGQHRVIIIGYILRDGGAFIRGPYPKNDVFRLEALALSVIATGTWLAGWLAGWLAVCHSRYCIKTTNLSEKFLDHPVGSSFKHLAPLTSIPNSTGNPFIGVLNTRGGWRNWRFSFDFRRTSPFISETVRDRPMATMER